LLAAPKDLIIEQRSNMGVLMLDLMGHIFYLLIVVGMLLLSKKIRYGWILRFWGEFGWVMIGVSMGMSSIYIWGFIFMGIDLYGFLRWSR